MKACYRKLHKYKYQLVQAYEIDVDIKEHDVDHEFMRLNPDGTLIIRKNYAWDGASFYPDTPKIMRGSLVHDALYQLLRLGKLEPKFRDDADELLRKICIADGMWPFIAWTVYKVVNRLGAKYATPGSQQEDQIICLPLD